MSNYRSILLVIVILSIVAVPLIYDQYLYTKSVTTARQTTAPRAPVYKPPSISNVPKEPKSVKLEKQSTYVSMNDAINASLDDHILNDHRFIIPVKI